MKSAAQALDIDAQALVLRTPDDVAGVLSSALASGTRALLPAVDNFINSQRVPIVNIATQNRLEAVYTDREWVLAGGPISLGPGHLEGYRLAAEYVDKVLHGANPADLPIATPTQLTVAVSRSALTQRGFNLPSTVSRRVNEWLP